MADAAETPATATGVRVLKGAVVAVLGIPSGGTTFAYKFSSATRGTLGVDDPLPGHRKRCECGRPEPGP